ncbi:MAG: hypothetical protein WEC83_01260 [Patescibacteria group bacterium]
MIEKNKIAIIVVALAFVLIGFVFFSQKGTVTVTISETSAIKDGVIVSFSADKYKRTYPAPGSIRLRPGTYQAIASSDSSTIFQQEITVRNGEITELVIALSENPNNALPGINPDLETINDIPYFSLFPHLTGDYQLEALLTAENNAIAKLQLTVIHHFASPEETDLYQNERNLAVTAAKQWLAENNVPDSFEIEIVDE